MSKKVLANVVRGMTDKTSVVVWEHEIPILKAIHGEVTIFDLRKVEDLQDVACVIRGTTQVIDPKDPRYRGVDTERVKVHEIVARNLGVGKKFSGDIAEEYDRLVNLYGNHPDYNMPYVEYVYGRLDQGRFKEAIGEIAVDEEDDEEHPGANPVRYEREHDGLTDEEIRFRLKQMNVDFPPTAAGKSLRKIYDAAISLAT